MDQLFLDGSSLSSQDIFQLVQNSKLKVTITKEVAKRIEASHQLLNKFVDEGRVIYGVNTSLGGFVNWLVPTQYAQELQQNLIAAVATNVGPYLDDKIVRAAILARLNSLARGNSAISLENFNKLLQIFNANIIPCVPSKGSLGASGDLGPLASIALVAVGKWKAKYNGQILSGNKALEMARIQPMELSFKEGLSLINGTSMMVGLASLLIEQTITLVKTYDLVSCLSFEGLRVKKKPFNPIVHQQKPHLGQLQTAENIWKLLKGSKLVLDEEEIEQQLKECFSSTPKQTPTPIEDSYAIRCTPHILGPIKDSLKWIKSVINNELNSSNDNPLILPNCNDVFHNGHFHGQYISMAMDHLSIALTTLSNLSDRRIDRFMDEHNSNGLPPFLCSENPGLRLGLMGGQFMSASLTAENRSLCNPVSTQTIPSTGDFQDIVSLGLVAARRAKELYDNVSYVVAFELLCAAQAVEIRGADLLGKASKHVLEITREVVPYLSSDLCLTEYLENLSELIKSGCLLAKVENFVGELIF